MKFRLAGCSAAVLAFVLAATPAGSANPPRKNKPPKSDGSSGSFDAQFGDGACEVWLNVDNGQVWCSDSGGYVKFTVPYKTVTWNGQTLHAFNFTDMNVEPGVKIAILGSMPAMFLAKQDINFAGQFVIAANAGKGGAAATINDGPYYKGGDGTGPNGGPGGQGGYGPGGETTGECCTEPFTAAGGGGGGNVNRGKAGHPGDWPCDAANPQYAQPGVGGPRESQRKLQGGEGSGAGGGGYFRGDFYAMPGSDGGGAVVFSTPGAISVSASGVIDASGHDGILWQYVTGGGGGGAGGDAWFYAGGPFSNTGVVTVKGGSGGKTKYVSGAQGQCTVRGPDGGDGSAGNMQVKAGTFDNRGILDVSSGGRTGANGTLSIDADIIREGTINGLQRWEIAR